MKKAASLSSLFLLLTVLTVNSFDEFLVPSGEDVFETQQSLVLPLTLECPYARHKYIEIHGVTLLNASDILIASSLVPNIEKLANEECFASLVQANDKPAKCEVSLQTLQQDDSFDHMEKVVTFDCRKALGDPSKNKKTISKKKGAINLKCDNKEAVPEILDISLASGQSVDKVPINWNCVEENVRNINSGNGGHCMIHRDGLLNDSEMTVTYVCSEPPKREIEEFVQGNGNNGRGNRGNGNQGNGNQGNGKGK